MLFLITYKIKFPHFFHHVLINVKIKLVSVQVIPSPLPPPKKMLPKKNKRNKEVKKKKIEKLREAKIRNTKMEKTLNKKIIKVSLVGGGVLLNTTFTKCFPNTTNYPSTLFKVVLLFHYCTFVYNRFFFKHFFLTLRFTFLGKLK